MKTAIVIFPHQLFLQHPALDLHHESPCFLVEDSLFFGDKHYPLNIHKQKLLFHRSSMEHYAAHLRAKGREVHYTDYASQQNTLEALFSTLTQKKCKNIALCRVVDYILQRRLERYSTRHGITLHWIESPAFLNTQEENQHYRSGKKRWYMADFYQWQRRRFGILLDEQGGPMGGQWSFDKDNRKKLPKSQIPHIPSLPTVPTTHYHQEAQVYIQKYFSNNLGSMERPYYPTTHTAAQQWLEDFLQQRFSHFGPYEDAIVAGHPWLYHSVLTPMLNTGLLTPKEVIDRVLSYGTQHSIPLPSLEGFIRQLIGWREFIRATYEDLGSTMRTSNHWGHHNPMPAQFYTGTTGLLPVDTVIHQLQQTGYCHHIERLMVLGGCMFLCEIHPEAIYRWFMEFFIDSYDWVMVPNVYSMSQHADGGLITTKPYFSGSNYIRKMSHYPPGPWTEIWDGLYWRWILRNSDRLAHNPRWTMMVHAAKRMDPSTQKRHCTNADTFLSSLHGTH